MAPPYTEKRGPICCFVWSVSLFVSFNVLLLLVIYLSRLPVGIGTVIAISDRQQNQGGVDRAPAHSKAVSHSATTVTGPKRNCYQ